MVAPPERAPVVLRALPPPRLGVKELPLLTELRWLKSPDVDLVGVLLDLVVVVFE